MPSGGGFSFSMTTKRIVKMLERRAPAEVGRALDRSLLDIGRKFEKHIVKNRLRGSTGSGRVGKRTGSLRNSFGVNHQSAGSSSVMHVGFGPPAARWTGAAKKYAAVHEGLAESPIRPKRRQFLAIPVADNLTGAGVARINSPLKLADAQFIPHVFATGPGFLVFQDDALMFILVREVKIPARLNFNNDWRRLRPGYERELLKSLNRAVRKAQQ